MNKYLLFIFILFFISCVESYDFSSIETVEAIIIDASLTNESTAHYVKISTSTSLINSAQNPVTDATVWIEDNEGAVTFFYENEPGTYLTNSSFAGEVGKSYTLHVETKNGNQFKSSEEYLMSPTPIDSVYGEFLTLPSTENGEISRGVQFFIDTHSNSTGDSYYRYEVEQDYAIQVPYASLYKWYDELGTYLFRDTLINTCYQHVPSSGVLITTTAGQTQNVISGFPIVLVEESEPYLLTKYSLIVKQFSISPIAYQYYKALKKNNEASGSFFDQQKGEVLGNISGFNNTSTPVLGFFEVAGVSTDKTLFNPYKWYLEGFNPERIFSKGCGYDAVADTVPKEELDSGLVDLTNRNIYYFSEDGGSAILVPKACSDCRLYGTLKKPDFWD